MIFMSVRSRRFNPCWSRSDFENCECCLTGTTPPQQLGADVSATDARTLVWLPARQDRRPYAGALSPATRTPMNVKVAPEPAGVKPLLGGSQRVNSSLERNSNM